MRLEWLRTPAMVLACGCLILCVSFGARAGMGLYLKPMGLEYSWGREIFSISMAIQNLAWGVIGAFAAAFADRFGTARVLAGAGVAYVVGLAAMAVVTTPLAMHLVSGVLIGVALAGTSFAIVMAVIGRTVTPERRSFALGIATAAGSFGQFALLPVTQWLISRYDWHVALYAMAGVAALIIPLSVALGGRPAPSAGAEQSLGDALHEAVRERGFHLLFWGFFVCGFHLAMLTVHLPAMVTDAGLKAEHGGTALALIGLFNIVGSLGSGYLGGLLSKKYLLSSIYAARALLVCMIVVFPLTTTTLYIFAAGMGLLWLSTVPLTNGLVGQIFGMRYAGMLASVVFVGHQIGSFVGVWLAGYLYDTTGTYRVVLLASVALGVFAAIVNMPVNETPLAERKAAPAAA
jgi:MFS family permease